MVRVALENVAKYFAGTGKERIGAVRQLNLSVAKGELLVIVGPSGCGKTTTLRLIAGLENPDSGAIFLDGASLAGVPAKERDIAMVFQNHALFPHLSVFDNMAFGLMLRKYPRAEIEERVKNAAATLNLIPLLGRKPAALSGGECQRATLGRALVRQPKVFLLDEPLSNLDAPMRLQLRGEIVALQRRVGATMIYVTHDQAEALAMADRVVVMKDGAVQQAATPLELYRRPANRFVAGFMGAPPMNFFEGRLIESGGAVVFEDGDGPAQKMTVKIEERQADSLRDYFGKAVTMGLRPEHIVEANGHGDTSITAMLERVEPAGSENLLYCSIGSNLFVARGPAGNAALNRTISMCFDMAQARFFDPVTGRSLESSNT